MGKINRRKFNRKKFSRKGVSEIIANILILGITVTLFSSIMWFVASMPAPHQNGYADFSADPVTYSSNYKTAYINVTHKGGQELQNYSTGIYLFVNESLYKSLRISNSTTSIGPVWSTGETWRYALSFPAGKNASKARISIIISDTNKNTELYNAILAGGSIAGSSAPIIGARGTTPSPTYAGTQCYFYATVYDPDGDLNKNSVYLNASSIGLGSSIKMTDSNNDGIFTCGPYTASLSWNGVMVLVNATDNTKKTDVEPITLSILQSTGGGSTQYGPYYNYSSYFVNGTYPPDASGGEAGGASGSVSGTTFYYIKDASTFAITRTFTAGQKVLIEVYSTSLTNLGLVNNFTMFQPLTGGVMVPPTKDNAFTYGGIYGTFYRYTYTFTVPDLGSPLVYPFQILLKDTMGTNINIIDYISILGANYPQLQVLRGNLTTGKLENTGNNFDVTDRLYVRVIMKDVDPSMTNVYMGAIKISDYSGRYIVNTMPSTFVPYTTQTTPSYTSPPVSQVFKSNNTGIARLPDTAQASNVAYTIYIVPIDAYQGWWLAKKNAYTLTISMVSDKGPNTGEIYYDLTTQINITAPLSVTDIVASIGSGTYTWSATGASYANNALYWYSSTADRRDQWQTTTIASNTYNGPIGLATADIDNDGKNDVIAAFQDPSVSVAWYRNQKIDGSTWSTPYLIASGFDALSGKQTAGAAKADGSPNGNRDEDSSLYSSYDSSYEPNGAHGYSGTYYSTNEIAFAMAVGDFNGDGQKDIAVSYVHVVIYNSATWSTSNPDSPTYNFPMFFNRGIFVYYGPTWQKVQVYGTDKWISAYTSNSNSNPAAMDLAAGDLNQDGYDDLVAVYENGTTVAWLSQAASSAGDNTKVFGPGSMVTLAPTVPGSQPWDHLGKPVRVRIADMDGNGYPDIIRTSSTSNEVAIFYTMPSGSTGSNYYPSKGYSVGPGATAAVKGLIANLTAIDGKWQNLTEVYLNYPMDKEVPYQKGSNDTTGQDISYLASDTDGQTYNVAPTQVMYIASFNANLAYQTRTLSSAVLRVNFSADSSYSGNAAILYSTDNGITYKSTGIVPTYSMSGYVATFDLKAAGVTTWAGLSSLDVMFKNSATSGTGTIRFNSVWIQAYYVNTTVLGYEWMISNDVTQPLEQLSMNYKCLSSNETFTLQYSPDNTTWFDLATLSSTTQTTVNFNLDYTTNSVYYVRVIDNNRNTTDTALNTLCVNYLTIKEYAPKVVWSNTAGVGGKIEKYLSDLPSGEYVTSIAVGDLGSLWSANHKPDGLNDIVVGTTKTSSGTGGARYSVYVFAQNAGGADFTQVPVYTPNIASAVDSNSYDVVQVQVGDFTGDGIPDIVAVMGFQKGVTSGTAPTLWLIENNPQPGGWQFTDTPINALSANQGAINAIPGQISLTILLPFMGLAGVIVAEAYVSKRKKNS